MGEDRFLAMRYRYQHWLNRQVGYEAMLSALRRSAHAATASAIESSHRDESDLASSEAAICAALAASGDSLASLRGVAAEIALHLEASASFRRSGLFFVLASRVLSSRGEFHRSLEYSGRAFARLDGEDPLGASLASLATATALERAGRFLPALEALDVCDSLAVQGERVPSAHVLRRALGARAFVHYRLARYDEALLAARECALRAREQGDAQDEAAARMTEGNVLGARGEWPKAEAAFRAVLALLEGTHDSRHRASALNNLAESWREQGRLSESERAHEESLALKKASGDRYGMIASLNNLGLLSATRADFPRAVALFGEALSLASGVSEYAEALCLMNLGNTLDHLGRSGEAELAVARSRAIRERMRDRMGIVLCDATLTGMLVRQGRYTEALLRAEACEAGASALSLSSVRARVLAMRAHALFGLNRLPEASRAAEEALRIAGGLDEKGTLQAAQLACALTRGDASLARIVHDEAEKSGNSLLVSEAVRVIARLASA